jgi:hypothetical protein
MYQSFDGSDRSIPPEFQTIIDQLRQRGLDARFRRWAMGDSVFVGSERTTGPGGIELFGRAIYIGRRDNGTWYASDLSAGEEDDVDEHEIVRYVERRLAMTAEEYRAEGRRQSEPNRSVDR